ncbi:peptidase inhibitor family I36 protein [Streptomyces sp. NPDC013455]|uniref:peptidase inhibitor family I36 protein n=1 Tax=Streptomyces sp. NPDC013455 TaxID=3155605 RepID=UPI0033D80DEC
MARRVSLVMTVTMTLSVGMITPGLAWSDTHERTEQALAAEIDQVLREHGGTKTAPNEITWHPEGAGTVVLSLPTASGTPSPVKDDPARYAYGCPVNWYCLYENKNFNGLKAAGETGPGAGRLLKWSRFYCDTGAKGRYLELGDYGFRDRASSWVNATSDRFVGVGNWRAFPKFDTLWYMNPNSAAGYVGDTNDDKADLVWSCTH